MHETPGKFVPEPDGSETTPSRPWSKKEQVIGALNLIGIDTDLKPWIEAEFESNKRGIPPRTEVAVHPEGYEQPVFSFGVPPMSDEIAMDRARITAPIELRHHVRRSLVELGVLRIDADMVSAIVRGSSVGQVANQRGLSRQSIYRRLNLFIESCLSLPSAVYISSEESGSF